MTSDLDDARALTATELAQAVAELRPAAIGAEVRDVALFATRDDIQLVLEQGESRIRLLAAFGTRRARLSPTRRRFARGDFATGPRIDLLERRLIAQSVVELRHTEGDRAATLSLSGGDALHLEFFGTRGLWALIDKEDQVVECSRAVATKSRVVRRGAPWQPPPTGTPRTDPPSRFPAPALDAIDQKFTTWDEAEERDRERIALERAIRGARKKLTHQAEGMGRRLAAVDDVPALRHRADMMLAYAHTVPTRGADHMNVPAVDGSGEERVPLDPARTLPDQAKTIYDRARKLEDGAATTRSRLEAAESAIARLDAADHDAEKVRAVLSELGLTGTLPKGPRPDTAKARPKPGRRQGGRHQAEGENFRRFVSAEGYAILCGRNNQQNDRLSVRVAKGNDVWLHVGGQRAGSHVVVRVPKGKTPSLETMLDAGHIAVHFSKARGETVVDVIYTHAKHVRKPKGLPPGAVLPAHTKTLSVRLEPDRLSRVLDSGGDE